MFGDFLQSPFWYFEYWENSMLDYILAVCSFVVLIIVFKGMQWAAIRFFGGVAERTKTEIDDAVVTVIKTIKPPFYTYLAFYIVLQMLEIKGLAEKVVDLILVSWLVYQVVLAVQIFLEFYIKRRVEKTDDKRSRSVMNLLRTMSSIALWGLGILFVMSNFGVDVSSLFVGLGIGGVAVALAAQNILGDVFSSLSIYFDKPFVPGDFIITGDFMGTVRSVGIKTTRIKSLSGEEVVFSNKELTATTIRNFGRMKERRVVFNIGVTYDTAAEKLRKVTEIVEEVVKERKKARFDRVHFKEFAESSLLFEVVYYMKTSNYEEYMDVNEEILLAIKERLEKEGVEMAFPTRMVYLKQT